MRFFFIFLSLIYYHAAMAQKEITYKPGYVVLLNGDTLNGQVMDRDEGSFGGLLNKVKFRPDKGWRKKYKPSQLLSYKRGSDLFRTIWLSSENDFFKQNYYSEPGRGEQVFVKVIYSGSLELYHREWTDEDNWTISFMPLIRKAGDRVLIRATQGIFGLKKKRLAEYFADCPKLAMAITEKEISTVEELIELYESSCLPYFKAN